MEIRTYRASEDISQDAVWVSLGGSVAEPESYEQPPLASQQETSPRSSYHRRRVLKLRGTPNQTTSAPIPQVDQVQQHTQSVVQPVPEPQVQPQVVQAQPDLDPVVPNLGPSAFRSSSKRLTLGSNRTVNNTSETPKSSTHTETSKEAKLRRILEDSIWKGSLLTYYRYQSVKFKLSPIQLQELGKIDEEISNIRDSTGKYDCRLLMNKFLLLESYNIPDIGSVYEDEVISKNFPMDLLRMILIAKGRNIDNLSKTQMINELNSYDRTVLAFTMVPSKIWGPDL